MMRVLFLTNNPDVTRPLYEWLRKEEGADSVLLWDKPLAPELFQPGAPLDQTGFVVSYNYRHMIRGDVMRLFPECMVNLHISLLPWNRGADPNFWSFIEDTPKGVTIHLVDEGLDTGDILLQREYFFQEEQETFASSYAKLQTGIQLLFEAHWLDIKHRRIQPVPQKGIGSVHSKKQFREFSARFPIGWDDNVARYKLFCKNNRGGSPCRI